MPRPAAVESFSKLADSIYFKQMPAAGSSADPARSHAAGATAAAAAAAPEPQLPQLFINQLVSSTLMWRELGVVLTQEAELYGPETAAIVRLAIGIADNSGGSGGGGGSGSNGRREFEINWRLPRWVGALSALLGPTRVCCALQGWFGRDVSPSSPSLSACRLQLGLCRCVGGQGEWQGPQWVCAGGGGGRGAAAATRGWVGVDVRLCSVQNPG